MHDPICAMLVHSVPLRVRKSVSASSKHDPIFAMSAQCTFLDRGRMVTLDDLSWAGDAISHSSLNNFIGSLRSRDQKKRYINKQLRSCVLFLLESHEVKRYIKASDGR